MNFIAQATSFASLDLCGSPDSIVSPLLSFLFANLFLGSIAFMMISLLLKAYKTAAFFLVQTILLFLFRDTLRNQLPCGRSIDTEVAFYILVAVSVLTVLVFAATIRAFLHKKQQIAKKTKRPSAE